MILPSNFSQAQTAREPKNTDTRKTSKTERGIDYVFSNSFGLTDNRHY